MEIRRQFSNPSKCSSFPSDNEKICETGMRFVYVPTGTHTKNAENYFCNPNRTETGSESSRLRTIERQKEEKRNSCSGKIDAGRKIFAFERLFPSHSVSRFSALSFCERGFLYIVIVESHNLRAFKWTKVVAILRNFKGKGRVLRKTIVTAGKLVKIARKFPSECEEK